MRQPETIGTIMARLAAAPPRCLYSGERNFCAAWASLRGPDRKEGEP